MVPCVDDIEIKGGYGSAVEDRANASYDEKVNVVSGQDPQYFQKPGTQILHGV